MEFPLLPFLAALVTGILLARFAEPQALKLLTLLPLLFVSTLVVLRRRVAYSLFRRSVYVGVATVFLPIGTLLAILHQQRPAPQLDAGPRETVIVTGCVVSPPAFYEGRDQFVVELAPRARARVALTLKDGEVPPALHYGQPVEFEAHMRAVRNFQNPGAFDYQGYLARSDIYWTATIADRHSLKAQPGSCGSWLLAAIFAMRTAAIDRIERLYRANLYATGMMEATLIGESSKLEKIWTEEFRRTGTYHMLVIDGLHITVLAAFFLFFLRLCFAPELTALALTAAGAWLYALISGWNAPAVRAAGGFSLYILARYFYRRGRLLNLLAAVAIIYLVCDPGQLFEAGFQLSFLSVAAIGALAIPLLESTSAPFSRSVFGITETNRDARLGPKAAQFRLELRLLAETLACYLPFPQNWIARTLACFARVCFYAWEIAVISTVIQIALALPMAIYFHRISLTGFSANILAVPLLALVVPAGFAAIFTGSETVARLAEGLLAAGEKVASWHVMFEPDWRVANPPFWLASAFSLAVVALAFALRHSPLWRWASATFIVILFTLIYWHPFPPELHSGELEVTAIDVGQGDSLLVVFPDGKLMLVDGGGVLAFGQRAKPRIDIGEDVVSPYLWRRSIRRIDVVVMTHAHDDHARGLPALMANFHPREVWTGATPPSDAWSAVETSARALNARIISMRADQRFDYGTARIEIISPPPDYVLGNAPKNNDSLAMRISYGDRALLLTGDIERQMEARALAENQPLRADVLKVAHHGSNTSSIEPFLSAVSPVFALISDGYDNSFRHPNPQVIDRLAAQGAQILRTDLDGLTTIRTDGHRMFVETFRARQESHHPYPATAMALP